MRPVLVVQSNYINDNNYPTTIIIPFSTKLIDQAQPLRYRIKKRENLHQDSDALIAHIRAIDNDRFNACIISIFLVFKRLNVKNKKHIYNFNCF